MSDMKDTKKHAVVYRMVMPDHLCPFGQKTLHLLKKYGYTVEDNHLETRKAIDAFILICVASLVKTCWVKTTLHTSQ